MCQRLTLTQMAKIKESKVENPFYVKVNRDFKFKIPYENKGLGKFDIISFRIHVTNFNLKWENVTVENKYGESETFSCSTSETSTMVRSFAKAIGSDLNHLVKEPMYSFANPKKFDKITPKEFAVVSQLGDISKKYFNVHDVDYEESFLVYLTIKDKDDNDLSKKLFFGEKSIIVNTSVEEFGIVELEIPENTAYIEFEAVPQTNVTLSDITKICLHVAYYESSKTTTVADLPDMYS